MFYTNVQPHGNFIALRGVNDRGESFKEKLNYEPTLFVESHKPQNPQWKTLDNRNVAPVKWGSKVGLYERVTPSHERVWW